MVLHYVSMKVLYHKQRKSCFIYQRLPKTARKIVSHSLTIKCRLIYFNIPCWLNTLHFSFHRVVLWARVTPIFLDFLVIFVCTLTPIAASYKSGMTPVFAPLLHIWCWSIYWHLEIWHTQLMSWEHASYDQLFALCSSLGSHLICVNSFPLFLSELPSRKKAMQPENSSVVQDDNGKEAGEINSDVESQGCGSNDSFLDSIFEEELDRLLDLWVELLHYSEWIAF